MKKHVTSYEASCFNLYLTDQKQLTIESKRQIWLQPR